MLRPNARQTKGQISKGDGALKGTCPVNGSAGSGRAFTITPVVGLGRQWVGDKDANAKRFAAQAKACHNGSLDSSEKRGILYAKGRACNDEHLPKKNPVIRCTIVMPLL